MILASLDLGSRLAYTLGPIEAERPLFGTHQLPATGDDVGLFITAWDRWLRGFIARMGNASKRIPGRLVFESPIMPRKTQMVTLRKLYGLASHLEFVCRDMGVDVCEINVMSMKRFWAGNGGASKDEMVATARRYGFDVEYHDEADAIAARFALVHAEYPAIAARMPWAMGNLGVTA